MTNQFKDQLGQATKNLESQFTPFYTSLEPYQRGLLILGLLCLLVLTVYYLSKPTPHLNHKLLAKREKELEERILRQMAFYKRLREE